MPRPARFAYTQTGNPAVLMPRLSLTLVYGNRSIDAIGLVDSGATVSVLPHHIGLALGANWNVQRPLTSLGGSLRASEVRALEVGGLIPQVVDDNPVDLVFAWAQSGNIPLILGQMNFFLEFDVCFFRADNAFEIQRR
jgi:hypothetical protein